MSVTLATESVELRPSADAVSTVEAYMSGVFEVQHPLIECHLTRLRDKTTPPPEFRQLVHRLASLLAYEATKDLRTEPVKVQTPLTTTDGSCLAQRIGLVPILRGLGMVEPVLELIPSAEVGISVSIATKKPPSR
jgi:uracil phosphoribosyltransferase